MAVGRRSGSPIGSHLPPLPVQRTGWTHDLPQGEAAITGPGPTEPPKRPLARSGWSRARLPSPLSSITQGPAGPRGGALSSIVPDVVSMPIRVSGVLLPQTGPAASAVPSASARNRRAIAMRPAMALLLRRFFLRMIARLPDGPRPVLRAHPLDAANALLGQTVGGAGAGDRLGAGDLEHAEHVGIDAAGHVHGPVAVVAAELVVD